MRKIVLLAVMTLSFFAGRSEAKPPPIYDENSMFGYAFKSDVDGMYGGRTEFTVSEIGASYRLLKHEHGVISSRPLFDENGDVVIDRITRKPVMIVDTITSYLGLTLMGIVGETDCEGIPTARSTFYKFGFTTNWNFPIHGFPGKFKLSVGARRVIVKTKGVDITIPGTENVPGGPLLMSVKSETLWDMDYGFRVEWKRSHGETGFLKRIRAEATLFDAQQHIREGKWKLKSSIIIPAEIGFETFYDTKAYNLGFGGFKQFGWKRGKYALELGGGYEMRTSSAWGHLAIKIDVVMLAMMHQTEFGDISDHILIVFTP